MTYEALTLYICYGAPVVALLGSCIYAYFKKKAPDG
jgi:hypothetical protein